MASAPLLDESIGVQGAAIVDTLAGAGAHGVAPEITAELGAGALDRRLLVYPAHAGYDMVDALDGLTNRAAEPNIFFAPRFAAPAMPRLEDRVVRFLLIEDRGKRNEARLLMPFSVDKPGFAVGHSILRAWSHPFGPLGTPLVDASDAARLIDQLLATLGEARVALPKFLVLPDLRTDGVVASLFRAVALSRGLPIVTANGYRRPALQSSLDGEAYLRQAIGAHHRRDLGRMRRKLEKRGPVAHNVARSVNDVRYRMEEFLALEAAGWKGRERSALASDRFRAAFAREAINSLAERDAVRIHTLDLAGRAIASLIVFVESGEAWAWKTAFDETHGDCSPGRLLIAEVTANHLDDPNIERTDSCAVPDHPVMSHMWTERIAMATLVIGLKPELDRETRQVASQLDLYKTTRNAARIVRDRVRALIGRD